MRDKQWMTKELIIASVSFIFGAGVAWGMLKQVRKDLNGLGARTRMDADGLGKKINRLEHVALAFCPEEQREKIFNAFNPKWNLPQRKAVSGPTRNALWMALGNVYKSLQRTSPGAISGEARGREAHSTPSTSDQQSFGADNPDRTPGHSMKSFFAALVLIFSFVSAMTGCLHIQSSSMNAFIDPACIKQPIELKDCDASSQPLHCRKVNLRYLRGCERLEATHVQPHGNGANRKHSSSLHWICQI
jgi:hypothetical protein